jgi:hypothetical protein
MAEPETASGPPGVPVMGADPARPDSIDEDAALLSKPARPSISEAVVAWIRANQGVTLGGGFVLGLIVGIGLRR